MHSSSLCRGHGHNLVGGSWLITWELSLSVRVLSAS